jgi:hypothetical protein
MLPHLIGMTCDLLNQTVQLGRLAGQPFQIFVIKHFPKWSLRDRSVLSIFVMMKWQRKEPFPIAHKRCTFRAGSAKPENISLFGLSLVKTEKD